MPQTATSLWPTAIRPSIKSPATILAAQAKELALQTDGVLVGELKTRDSEDGQQTVHTLDMYAPVLDYRHRVLSARHAKSLIFPVVVAAEVFRPKNRFEVARASPIWVPGRPEPKKDNEVEAASDEELIGLVKQVLNSTEVVGVAISLIAKAEEVAAEEKATGNGTPSPNPT